MGYTTIFYTTFQSPGEITRHGKSGNTTIYCLTKKFKYFLFLHIFQWIIRSDKRFCQFGFTLLKALNFLLNGVVGDKPVYKYIFILPDPVSPVQGLHLRSRIPPGIQDKYVIRRGKV